MLTMDDKYRFEDFGLICEVGHENPLTPNMENKTLAIPGRVGLWDFGTETREKPFNFPLGIIDWDRVKLQKKLNDFIDFLFDPFGQPRNFKISFDYEPDKYYIVRCTDTMLPERLINASKFNLPLTAYNPWKFASANQYDPKEDTLYGQVKDGDYYDNPKSFNWIYSKHYSGVYNYSHYVTEFAIEIVGTVKNPKVTNLESYQTLTLPSITNGTIEVKPTTFEIIKDGISTLVGSNYNFFNIQPGKVGFLFEGENPNATVRYKWLHKFK